MQWGGVVMGVGAGTHTLLCVHVGVIVHPRVCVCTVWQGCVGRKCGLVGGERAAVMCRVGCGRVGGVVAGWARVVVVPCV